MATTKSPAKVIARPTRIDKVKFFATVRETLFNKKLTAGQVKGMDVIIDTFEAKCLPDLRWLAYMMATALHETAGTMQAIEEYGKGRGYDYGKKLKMGGGRGKRIAYTTPDKLYFGRGLVQLTWFENYQLMGRLLGYDLLNKPELALDLQISVEIMFEGMLKGSSSFGDFTGRCLEQYFNSNTEDWVNARRIINGLDKAALIAGYAKKFYAALK